MKGYKGFDKDLKCRGMQYEIGKTYETDKAKLCEKGFHFCEAPFDVLNYYGFVNNNGVINRFCEVEADDVSDEKTDDSKRVSKKLTVGAEIGIPGLVKAHVEYVKSKCEDEKKVTGNCSAATNTGDCSAATNTGNHSAATNTGDWSAATNTGDWSAATNTGYQSAATNTGNQSAATNTGRWSAATVATGGSVAVVIGKDSKARAGIGSAIVICERGEWNGRDYPLLNIKAAIIDGETLKADTWYTLKNGEFVEVDE